MTDFTVSTNLISWVPAKRDIFGWPIDGAEAEVIDTMQVGDTLIPKFAQNPDFGMSSQAGYVTAICEALGLDYEEEFADYEQRVDWGTGAVPFIWTVEGSPRLDNRFPNDVPWLTVPISQEELRAPFSTSEFLRLRVLPIEIARQFKAMAAPGRHIQRLPEQAREAIQLFGNVDGPREGALRSLSLAKEPVLGNLEAAGLGPMFGDFVFLLDDDRIVGLLESHREGQLTRVGEEISISPAELPGLIAQASERAVRADRFHPGNALAAANELAEFAASEEAVRPVPEFGTFYDRYILLPKKVSQALELASRDLPTDSQGSVLVEEATEVEDGEQDELDNLHGLTVSATAAELPDIVLSDAVLAEAVTALRAGKHLLLSGPPGTGKSTIAAALCRAVVGAEFDLVTATADWTTFETIGGYMPRAGGDLDFEPGLILRALQRGRWLVVDEINRADIDKAFGPLFTLLAGSGDSDSGEDVVLPYRQAERSIRIVRSERREGARSPYAITPAWRLIGTLNARDKASLFRLSFAFLRRFALIDVPLPDREQYKELYEAWSRKLDDDHRARTVEAAMEIAFGRRQLGPAILKDIAEFTEIGVVATETESRSGAYDDPVAAFLTAVRLYAVPQYEGASKADSDDLLQRLRRIWPEPPASVWNALERAFEGVVLS